MICRDFVCTILFAPLPEELIVVLLFTKRNLFYAWVQNTKMGGGENFQNFGRCIIYLIGEKVGKVKHNFFFFFFLYFVWLLGRCWNIYIYILVDKLFGWWEKKINFFLWISCLWLFIKKIKFCLVLSKWYFWKFKSTHCNDPVNIC